MKRICLIWMPLLGNQLQVKDSRGQGNYKIKMQREKVKYTEQNSKLDTKARAYKFALQVISLVDNLSNNRAEVINGRPITEKCYKYWGQYYRGTGCELTKGF